MKPALPQSLDRRVNAESGWPIVQDCRAGEFKALKHLPRLIVPQAFACIVEYIKRDKRLAAVGVQTPGGTAHPFARHAPTVWDTPESFIVQAEQPIVEIPYLRVRAVRCKMSRATDSVYLITEPDEGNAMAVKFFRDDHPVALVSDALSAYHSLARVA